eukprot:702100-Amorphochlora_amoeboformis.AAC.1
MYVRISSKAFRKRYPVPCVHKGLNVSKVGVTLQASLSFRVYSGAWKAFRFMEFRMREGKTKVKVEKGEKMRRG